MKLGLSLLVIFFAITVINGGRRGGGGNGRDTDREVREAIAKVNAENQKQIAALTGELNKSIQAALDEAQRARQQIQTMQSQREQEKADEIAERDALESAMGLLSDTLLQRNNEESDKNNVVLDQQEAYETMQNDADANDESEARTENEALINMNKVFEKNSLDEMERKSRLDGDLWKRARDKVKPLA